MLFEPSRNRILHEGSNGLPDQDRSRTTRSRRGERTHKQSGQVRVCEPSRKNCANLPDNYHLQLILCERINRIAERSRLALAFPELRVVFGGAAYVPDVSVYRWARIPRTPDGRVANVFGAPPDVAIEIVSPEQSTNALLRRC